MKLKKDKQKQVDDILETFKTCDAFILCSATKVGKDKEELEVKSALVGELAELEMIVQSNLKQLHEAIQKEYGETNFVAKEKLLKEFKDFMEEKGKDIKEYMIPKKEARKKVLEGYR